MYKCDYCSRVYTLKKYYVKHFAFCKEYNKMQLEKDVDRTDYEPTMKEMFHIMKEMTFKIGELEKEVKRLKTTTNTRNRKEIMTMLNEHCTTPQPSTFNEWIQSVAVNDDHLKTVFQLDLNEGIKDVLSAHFKDAIQMAKMPICCFSKKPNQFYIFSEIIKDEDNHTEHCAIRRQSSHFKWRKTTNHDFEKLLSSIHKKILLKFFDWQNNNRQTIDSNESLKEKEINNMIKINCSISSMNRRIECVKKWMFSKLQDAITEHSVLW